MLNYLDNRDANNYLGKKLFNNEKRPRVYRHQYQKQSQKIRDYERGISSIFLFFSAL